jgi:hypothetical protein
MIFLQVIGALVLSIPFFLAFDSGNGETETQAALRRAQQRRDDDSIKRAAIAQIERWNREVNK